MEQNLKQKKSGIIKIVLFGPESTGKTTLSIELAKHYNTVWAPEFAREYLQKKWNDAETICEIEDIIPIAIGQTKLENNLLTKANKVIFCDTNILETKIYAEAYYKDYSNEILNIGVAELNYDLYFLTDIDVPYEEDDLRDRPEQRQEMFDLFKNGLNKHQCNYQVLSGDLETRLINAKRTIDKLLSK
jgi:HTH-type transcriptional regulator, transcriptional repressor of NAD biosynthesis genes